MLLVANVARLVAQTLHFGVAGRRLFLVAAILLGLVAIAVVSAAPVAVPFAVYPFA